MSTEKVDYHRIRSADVLNDDSPIEDSLTRVGKLSRVYCLLWPLALTILLLTIIVQSVGILILYRATQTQFRSIHGMNLERTELRTLYQPSKYTSLNETEASEAWNSILTGHGIMAFEPEYALQKNLPDTMELPGSGGKKIYVIEAYHAMHCLVVMRQHYAALERNERWGWTHHHDLHCFDTLRQYIMCNIDDTLLTTWGKNDVGRNQKKLCHDWDRLRDWAAERLEGYLDFEPGSGIKIPERYHKEDGLPVGSLS